jgi:hypothetical protein
MWSEIVPEVNWREMERVNSLEIYNCLKTMTQSNETLEFKLEDEKKEEIEPILVNYD